MKTITRLTLVLTVLLFNCIHAQSNNSNLILKEVAVTSFENLKIDGAFNVIIKQGNKESLFIETEEKMMNYVKTRVKNGTLKISFNTGNNSSIEFEEIKLLITVKNLKELNLDGFIEFNVSNTLITNNLNLTCKGATKGMLNINAKFLTCNISSFSDLIIKGQSDNLSIKKTDASSINTLKLKAKTVHIKSSGFGEVNVSVEDELNISSSGAVAVNYKGNPRIKEIDIKELSKLSKMK